MLDLLLKRSGARALLFDMDGTLIDNMDFHRRAFLQWAREENLTGSDDDIMAQTHGTIREIVARLFPAADENARRDLALRKEAIYRELYRPHLRLLPGLEKLLREAAARNIPLALATAGDWPNIEFTLDGCDVRALFPVVVSGEDVTRGKPDPEVFTKTAAQLGLAPRDCLVLEDSPAGVEAARRGGMKCVVINAMAPREAFGDTDHVLCFAGDYHDLERQMNMGER